MLFICCFSGSGFASSCFVTTCSSNLSLRSNHSGWNSQTDEINWLFLVQFFTLYFVTLMMMIFNGWN